MKYLLTVSLLITLFSFATIAQTSNNIIAIAKVSTKKMCGRTSFFNAEDFAVRTGTGRVLDYIGKVEGDLKSKYGSEASVTSGYTDIYSVAVVISYEKRIAGWSDCKVGGLAFGFGNTPEEALQKAVKKKSEDSNTTSDTPYTIVKTVGN